MNITAAGVKKIETRQENITVVVGPNVPNKFAKITVDGAPNTLIVFGSMPAVFSLKIQGGPPKKDGNIV